MTGDKISEFTGLSANQIVNFKKKWSMYNEENSQFILKLNCPVKY